VILRLAYGKGALVADLRGLHCRELRPETPHHHAAAAELAAKALDAPAAGSPLVEVARGRRRVAVLVPDATRKTALPEVLPEVLDRIARAGVEAEAIDVLVACGTHPAASASALAALVGRVPAGVRVTQHDAHDVAGLVQVGVLPSGVPVRLNRIAVNAELVVAVSTVQHHYFAGFGGGPKMLFPGVAGYAETQANHAKVIDLTASPPRRHPACEPGRLEGNPVAEEIAAAAALRPLDFVLLMVPGEDGRPAWASAGPLDATFPAACAKAREWFEVAAGPFARIVVSAGGFPIDHTLIQAHKALDAACRFAAPEAEVLFLAACDGGAGSPEMEPFLADPWPEAIAAKLAERYVQYGHTTLRLVEKTSRFRVMAKTELPVGQAERLGLNPVRDVQGVLDRWREEAAHEAVGVIAGAPVYPRLG
jgi:nickel-dependent lactate racemase